MQSGGKFNSCELFHVMFNSALADGEFLVCMQDHCRSCQGVGVVKGNREVRVDIPAGKLYPHPHRLL